MNVRLLAMRTGLAVAHVFLVLFSVLCPVAMASEDILVADFEGGSYGGWTIEGDAFGNAPAAGKLSIQGPVTGFKGRGLVNTFQNRDRSTGTLTSPPFEIQKDYITFLIGGGASHDSCLQLLVDPSSDGAFDAGRAKVVASSSGLNDEALIPAVFDVRGFRGEQAVLRVVDQARGGWGHVNVDHIVMTDEKPDAPMYGFFEKTIALTKDYLILPIQNEGQKGRIRLFVDDRAVRIYDMVLAEDSEKTDWYAFLAIDNYKGQDARIQVERVTKEGFELVNQADQVPGSKNWYRESHRPQFHFTQKVGWNNDPNGMIYHKGKYHLFFQHNPLGIDWGNMTWGHAVSSDLLHWEQKKNALFPYVMARGICASGSAVTDSLNTGGWGAGALIALFSDNRTPNNGESIAASTDGGQNFTYWEKSPFYHHAGRDPKVIWYAYDETDTPLNTKAKELGGHWVMAVYDEGRAGAGGKRLQCIEFHTSVNLKDWTYRDHVTGYFECPELFELPVDDDTSTTKWVVFGANAEYQLGDFDGRSFMSDSPEEHRLHYGKYYAAQTFTDAPDGRRIQMGWVRIPSPGPYNQHFSFPHRNTLRTTVDGIRMFAEPIEEIATLHGETHTIAAQPMEDGVVKSSSVNGRLFDIRTEFEVGTAKAIELSFGRVTITYDAVGGMLFLNETGSLLKDGIPLQPVNGRINLQILVDNSFLEVIGNHGRVYLTESYCSCARFSLEHNDQGAVDKLSIQARGGRAELNAFHAHEMRSIWRGRGL